MDEEGAIVTIAAWICPGTSTQGLAPEELATACTEPVPGVDLELASDGTRFDTFTTDAQGQTTLDPAPTGDLSIVPRPPDGFGFGFASIVTYPDGPDGDALPPVVSASPSAQIGWAVEPGSLSVVDLFIFDLDDAYVNSVLIEHYLCDAPMDPNLIMLEAMVAACSPTTSPGTGFTIPSSLGATYQVATPIEDGDPAFAQFTWFPYVPHEPVTVTRDLVAGHEQSLAWCRWLETSNMWAGSGDGELGAVPVDITGTMTLLVNAANPFTVDEFHCYWFSYPTEDAGYQPPHLVPSELPIQVLCDPQVLQSGIQTTCEQELPETMQLCNTDIGNQRQITNCVPDATTIPEATAVSAGTSRIEIEPVLCASHSGPDPQTIQEAETACEPRQSWYQTHAPVYLANMTLNVSGWMQEGSYSYKVCCWKSWDHVPEGSFTITRDSFTTTGDPFEFHGESVVFCSWEAQISTQNGPGYAVAYDILMDVSEDDVLSGVITWPGTDMTCTWFNYPDPERIDTSNDPVPQLVPTEAQNPALQPVEGWHPPEPVIPGDGEEHPPDPIEPDPSGD